MDYATNPSDGVRIGYQVVGSGPPLMLVHGSLLTHVIWRTFGYAKVLRPNRTLILVDMRGHGRSDKPHEVDAYSMSSMVGDLTAVLDAVGVEKVDYWGYSFGARAGLTLTAHAPERVNSLIAGGGSHGSQAGAFDRLFFPGCADVLAERGMDGFITEWNEHRMFPVDDATRAAFAANDTDAMAAYFRASDAEPGLPDDALRGFDLPCLFYVGSEDRERLAAGRAAADLVPGAQFHLIEGFDHSTTPAASEEVLGVVTPFLGRHSPYVSGNT
ncbi:MAG: alpha/beta hydrolase [Rhodococcus sp. (in: high G+C Gram-positive bacteria)]|jgi:pimeloyl-ACP methyl ester carboxylesterase|uniref:alpha/beta fold hydrolase n=1 Tax=Rhodococcus sp. I2R TaxID=2855445 RepID=UPI001E2A54CA|nr:alpha/beta hydrolase [Rhodococcus sp. I2R]MCC8927887.1 alpha/beta hydrolase [Rhodococcus sp. I2R]